MSEEGKGCLLAVVVSAAVWAVLAAVIGSLEGVW